MNNNQMKNNYLEKVRKDLNLAKNIDWQDVAVIGSIVIDEMPPKTFCTGDPNLAIIGIASQINMLGEAVEMDAYVVLKEIKKLLDLRR